MKQRLKRSQERHEQSHALAAAQRVQILGELFIKREVTDGAR